MKSADFAQSNFEYEAKGPDEVPVPYNSLHVYRGPDSEDYPVVISRWIPTEEELKEIILNKSIWLSITGGNMPPVSVAAFNPFELPIILQAKNMILNDASGAFEILYERFRVIAKAEGFQISDDLKKGVGNLKHAAVAYLFNDKMYWPFGKSSFNPGSEEEALIKAGQFIAAALDVVRFEKSKNARQNEGNN